MEANGKSPLATVGVTVPVWLPAKIRPVFERHVGGEYGAAGRFGKAAIIEKLQREGAFDDKQADRAQEVLKGVPVSALPLVIEFAELVAARGERGQAAMRAALEALKNEEMDAAPVAVAS